MFFSTFYVPQNSGLKKNTSHPTKNKRSYGYINRKIKASQLSASSDAKSWPSNFSPSYRLPCVCFPHYLLLVWLSILWCFCPSPQSAVYNLFPLPAAIFKGRATQGGIGAVKNWDGLLWFLNWLLNYCTHLQVNTCKNDAAINIDCR